MLHHTQDIGLRAFDVARHEGEKAYRKTGDAAKYFKTVNAVYEGTLKELQPI